MTTSSSTVQATSEAIEVSTHTQGHEPDGRGNPSIEFTQEHADRINRDARDAMRNRVFKPLGSGLAPFAV